MSVAIIYDILHDAPVARGIDAVHAAARCGVDEFHDVTGHMGLEIELENETPVPSTSLHVLRHVGALRWVDGRPVKLWIARAKATGDTKVELHPYCETTNPNKP